MRMWRGMGAVACCWLMMASCQAQDAPIQPPAKGPNNAINSISPVVTSSSSGFAVPETNMTFQYPSTFHVDDASKLEHLSYRAAFGNPKERGSEGCSPVLLVVGTGATGSLAQPAEAEHYVPDPPTGGITLQEIKKRCIDPKMSEKDILSALAGGMRGMAGYNPIAGLTSYQAGKGLVYLSGVQAYSKDKDGVRRASVGETLIANIAMSFEGRFFLWTAIANDERIFNELMSVRVQFGKDESLPLVPFRAGDKDVPNSGKMLPM